MIDCHAHSCFSGDSEMDAVEACNTALERGLEGLTFTDHLDIDFPDTDVTFNIDFEQYGKYMVNLKKKFEGTLKVFKGIEVGIMPHVIEESLKIVRSHDFDFVLASIHVIEGIDTYRKEYFFNKTKEKAYSRYLEEALFMIRNFDDFDVMGHFDFVIRYAPYSDKTIYYRDFSELFDVIFRELIKKGKGMEVNTGSYRDIPKFFPYPSFDMEVIKRYKELGGEIITMGSDSHQKDFIGYKFDYFKQVLLEAGFRYIAHYEGRRPVFEKIG